MGKIAKFADRLRQILEERNMTAAELSKRTGISKSSISHYLKGDWKGKQDVIYKIAKETDCDESWIMGADVPMQRSDYSRLHDFFSSFIQYSGEHDEILVPVVAEIAAGFDKQPIRDYEMDRFPVPSVYAKGRRTDELFIIKVRGDSMYPMYQEGDHVLAVRTPTVEDGEVAILQYEDNATIKRVERVKDGLRLIPINPMYKSETVTDGDKVRVVCKPLVLIRELAEDVKT